jgi:hypothetical protein
MLNDCDNTVPLNVHLSPQIRKALSLSRNLNWIALQPQKKIGIEDCTPMVNIKEINFHHNMLMTTVSYS